MPSQLCLPPAPLGYSSAVDDYVGVWASIPLPVEPAGTAFFHKYEVVQCANAMPVDSSTISSPAKNLDSSVLSPTEEEEDENGKEIPQNQRKRKGLKDGSITGKVKEAIENEMDLYKLICGSPSSSVEDLKKNYRKLALIFHPDKRSKNQSSDTTVLTKTESMPDMQSWNIPNPNQMTDEEIKQHFILIQTAFEILSDDVCRKQYDSSLPFDEDLPTAAEVNAHNFFELCGPAFEKESKWSTRKPVPPLGDASTPVEHVKRFYRFWTDFESWRDFSQYAEHKIEEAESRDERRWMQKENWRIVSKYVKQERQRVHQFVCLAESKDPRLLAEKEAEYRRKEEAKAARLAAQREAQQKAMETQRQREELQRAKEEAEAKQIAQKKKEEKRIMQDLRKRIRKYFKNHCQETNQICEFTADDLTDYCQVASQEWLSAMLARIETGLKATEDDTKKPETVAKTIRAVMSEWNSSRYKTAEIKTTTKIEAEPKKKQHEWSADELSSLSKALVRFPGGTPNRWTQIASFVGNGVTADEAIEQAKHMSVSKPALTQDPFELSQKQRTGEDKKKTPDQKEPATVSNWTPEEQTSSIVALIH
eukprot:Gregarina_sp_Poly_1__10272@NODE_71_length_16098_cov_96_674880_g61_i0_p4_GENE_NODE_71_length_16098_cov_96_674880_g61_i0NODE_71_length_16098_cov_96_674880_g61_i0_p4_ORF_typecomplete_len592_score126_56DnaJ/PF00226_31/8_8e14Borrelia_P83/PF05262_11/5_7e03Borrelia_P83/PF05262_11/0_00034Borrelia_P83/PF05262_11/1_8e04AAA_23/PF13476_6/0_008AAA_23/PF13476_6/4_4e03DUF1871/PF08958_10/2_2DUF1871/PF08958_10/1_5e02SPECT1/PF18680_1/7_3SPECT1/PF18680_1/27Myb_DNAbinding/PF00249_31/4_6e03Myb_DNAbinding/PF00249_31/